MKRILVIGGGAAGMLAAIMAARNGAVVSLFEKNDKLGKKIYITGKGRCNLTNAGDMEDLFEHIMSNRNFLYSAFYSFSNQDTIDFFNEIGLSTKVERGNRVFPVSDHSSDVIKVLTNELKTHHVEINLQSEVKDVVWRDGKFSHIVLSNNQKIEGESCIIATGGLSYPSTGSTGDGYRFAQNAGHTITDLSPSLTGIHLENTFIKELEGLSLKNIRLTALVNNKKIFEEFGEMVFTHDGVSGPLILSASSHLIPYMSSSSNNLVQLYIDLKPALSEETLDLRILREFDESKNKQFKNSLNQLLPQKLIHVIIERSGIDSMKKVHSITKDERKRLLTLLKKFDLDVKALGGYNEAVVTKGGVHVKEINPSTMESKLIKNIYFAGEVMDLDAMTGGYNLQIAWSTGYLAGMCVKEI